MLVFHLLSSRSHARYESGDHVAVYPANDSSLVNQIGEILGTDLDTIMSLNNLDGEYGSTPVHQQFSFSDGLCPSPQSRSQITFRSRRAPPGKQRRPVAAPNAVPF